MTTFSFTIVLRGPMPTLDEVDRLYGRCPDASQHTSEGISRIDFDREAATFQEAMRSAVADVRAVGFEVERVELEPDALAVA